MKYCCFYYVFNQINAALMSTRDILIHVDGPFLTRPAQARSKVMLICIHCTALYIWSSVEFVVAMTTFIQDVINSHTHVEQSAVF